MSKTLTYEFWNDYIKPKYEHYAPWIQIAISFKLKSKVFIKTLQMMLEKYLIYQIMKLNKILLMDHYQKEKIKK